MRITRRLASLGLAAITVWLLYSGGVYRSMERAALERAEGRRMRNVTVTSVPRPEPSPEPTPGVLKEDKSAPLPAPTMELMLPPDIPDEDTEVPVMALGDEILETTISGGLNIKNETGYSPDIAALLRGGPQLSLPAEQAQILIIHTHSSEAYAPAGLDRYQASDEFRTEDAQFNIVRVGKELADKLSEAGLHVVHDQGVYDYPSYTGSYNRSAEAIEEQLKEHPGIVMVIDVHRDALGENGVVYKTMAEEDGVCASQAMLLVGSDASGLEHPNWQRNLAAALYLQQAVCQRYPTLMRPVALVQQRYNQHLSPASMILEVGSSGNTLQEALASVRLFADAAAPALLSLVK